MMQRDELCRWLREADQARLCELWQRADATRSQWVGDAVHLRGLIELSNYCRRLCGYCGLRAPNQGVERYRMTRQEVMVAVRLAKRLGFGTVVLQSGEDRGLETLWLADLIHQIKVETKLAVTLSLGERDAPELELWRAAGADRYLLRFETSNRELFKLIHPGLNGASSDRIAMLGVLRDLGYEVGSGVMIGIPGQSYDDLADDLELFGKLDLDMIGVGPFLPHPETPLGRNGDDLRLSAQRQVPNNDLMAYKVLALTRLMCPSANIPSTTALATLDRESGYELGLTRGANVVMPNVTPAVYRRLYQIYPDKACFNEKPDDLRADLECRLGGIGRVIGTGRGDSRNWRDRCGGQVSGRRLA